MSPQHTHLDFVTNKVIADMRRRGLSPGERYLNTEEASQLLGLRKAVVNQALKRLADQQILVRRQRSGTFVGPAFHKFVSSRVQVVYVLLQKGSPTSPYWPVGPFTHGILSEFGAVNLQFSLMPEHDPVGYVAELLESPLRDGQLAGIVPVSCTPEVYDYLGKMQVPIVAFGSIFADPAPVCSVDVDYHQAGELLTQYLVNRGHRRMALVAVGEPRRGDNDFYDAVSEMLRSSNLPHASLIHRLLPNHRESFESSLVEMMRLSDQPTAIIARGPVVADWAYRAAKKFAQPLPENFEVVLDHGGQVSSGFDLSKFVHVAPVMSIEEIASLIGKKLRNLADGNIKPADRIKIPVELHIPDSCKQPK